MSPWKIILAMAVLINPAGLSAADDLFVGAWKLNVAKSRYNPGPLPKSSSNTYEPVPGGGLKIKVSTITAPGTPRSFERIERYDGKPYPVHGEPGGADAVSTKRVDPYTIEVVSYYQGKVMSRLTRKISKDGKTMTSTSQGTNPQGQPFEEFRFFERQ